MSDAASNSGPATATGMRRRWWLLALVLLLPPWLGAAPADEAVRTEGGRERIDAERRVVEARYKQALVACQGRFLLTRCLDAARSERRLALDLLQRQQLEIDDVARRERAAARQQALGQRSREVDSAAPSRLPNDTPQAVAAPVTSEAASGPASAPIRHRTVVPARRASAPPSSGSGPMSAAQRAPKNQAEYLKRQQEAKAHPDGRCARHLRCSTIR